MFHILYILYVVLLELHILDIHLLKFFFPPTSVFPYYSNKRAIQQHFFAFYAIILCKAYVTASTIQKYLRLIPSWLHTFLLQSIHTLHP